MSIYKILENGNPVLKVPLTGVSEDCNREELKSDLIETMKEHGGIGLSANQVGVMERVFIFYEDFKTTLTQKPEYFNMNTNTWKVQILQVVLVN